MKTKLIYLLIGIALIVGIFSTNIDSIDEDTLTLIEKAREVDLEYELWPGYKLSDYAIDVNYGKVEFRYNNGEITKQKPSLEVLAFTAELEENGPVIKVLPESRLSGTINIMGNMSKKERRDVYISTLFHEGFHAFQMENGGIDYDNEQDNHNLYEKFNNILYKLDNDEKYQKLWIEELSSMLDYLEDGNKELWVGSFNNRKKYLKILLGKDFDFYMRMENDRELIEGTAKYVEDKSLEILTEEFNKPKTEGIYIGGVSKFYLSGRVKCLILDKGIEWKEDLFNSSKTLTDLLI